MKSFRYKILVILTVSISLFGCDNYRDKNDTKCDITGKYPALFLGGSVGYGTINFTKTENHNLLFSVMLKDDSGKSGAKPVIEISGISSCNNGIVKGSFAGGITNRSNIKVMGGDFSAIFNLGETANISRPFGTWTLGLHDSETNKTHNIDGFWRLSQQ
jgi:hypothetical protein|tara:strand:+ start:10985 stop:11461 length:477 start_codon:yes stop_codon:yes gene_type:complete